MMLLTKTGNRWNNKFVRKDSAVGYIPAEIPPSLVFANLQEADGNSSLEFAREVRY